MGTSNAEILSSGSYARQWRSLHHALSGRARNPMKISYCKSSRQGRRFTYSDISRLQQHHAAMLLSDAKDTQHAGLRLPPASRPIRRAQFSSSSSARRQRPPPRCPWKRWLLSQYSRASFVSQMPADCVFCDSVVADFPQGHHHAIALATFCEDALFRDGPHLSRQARKCRTRHKTQAKS